MHTLESNTHGSTDEGENPRRKAIRQAIGRAAERLPSQGPITVFVHHNTLHAFEHLDFDEGVQTGGRLFGCHAYLPEETYRAKLDCGRIRLEDLEAALLEDLGDDDDRLVSVFCTRFALRLAMLQFPLHSCSIHQLRWVVAETDALRRFRREVSASVRTDLLVSTRQVVLERRRAAPAFDDALDEVIQQFQVPSSNALTDSQWESFVLNYLWRVCCEGVKQVAEPHTTSDVGTSSCRHRDCIVAAGGEDADQKVHETLIRFTAAFLDQGFADWHLPNREDGFYRAFLKEHVQGLAPTRWYRTLRRECQRLLDSKTDPFESIDESLHLLGVTEEEQDEYVMQSLLALRGWAGMVWQLETNAEWAPWPAPAGSLTEFLAIRLLLDRISLEQAVRRLAGFQGTLDQLRDHLPHQESRTQDQVFDLRAFTIFQLAQVLGWRPHDLHNLAQEQWSMLVGELSRFPALERRRIYHRAFERNYRNQTLDAIIAHNRTANDLSPHAPTPRKEHEIAPSTTHTAIPTMVHGQIDVPRFQLVTCIDDREESFRRHVEEVCPECETFGVAGFFGTAMYYRGLGHAHFKPLCPVSIKPTHRVTEGPVYSQTELERRKAMARRRLGKLSHQTHRGSRSFFGGIVTALAGSLAAFPLVGRVLFPRATSRLRSWLGRIVDTPATELRIENVPTDHADEFGFTIDEMANIVEGVLCSSGISARWSPLVILLGHGSSSLNNPHESAYNCGACAGSQGGPNARAFAQMANDHRVRRELANRKIHIPDETVFVGGYHDTTNESVTFSDLDRLPVSHRHCFEEVLELINEARRRNAHERCRRFESAPLDITTHDALLHVQDRPEDLSQARPEYNHATNALGFVGRRQWSRGLFLDRRAFLTSYDPGLDDSNGSVLEGLLQAAIPVCAGISLEYYFSTVDVEGYGCGSKLPHNITSLLGVMSGASSDLRPGLSQQMVEIHEPMRILFVVETSVPTMKRIIDNVPNIARLVKGEWVQLAVYDPDSGLIHRFVRGEFVLYAPHQREIPTATTSREWYSGQRGHLGFASITAQEPRKPGGVA